MKQYFSVGEAAKAAGTTSETLRHYDRIGLVKPSKKDEWTNYRYYTGIIFAGYTFGSGEPIVKGGRYDSLLSYFGKNAPAIGFALMADQLLGARERI